MRRGRTPPNHARPATTASGRSSRRRHERHGVGGLGGRSTRVRASLWRYSPLLPAITRTVWTWATGGPPAPGAPPRGGARAAEPVDQGRDEEPDALVQGSRRLGRADEGPGVRFGTVAWLQGNLAHAVAAHAAASGLAAVTSSVRPGVREARRGRGLRRDAHRGGRNVRRRQPTVRRGLRRVSVGVRQREPARVLRRRVEDDRVRDGGAARVARARSRRGAHRIRRAADPHRQGVPGAAHGGAAGRGAGRAGIGRPGRRVRARRDGVRRRRRQRPTGPVPDTIAKSLAIGDPADGMYALREVRSSGGRIGEATNQEIVDAVGSSPGPRASSPRRPVGSRSRCWRSSRRGRGPPRLEGRRVRHGHGVKTLEAFGERSRPP